MHLQRQVHTLFRAASYLQRKTQSVLGRNNKFLTVAPSSLSLTLLCAAYPQLHGRTHLSSPHQSSGSLYYTLYTNAWNVCWRSSRCTCHPALPPVVAKNSSRPSGHYPHIVPTELRKKKQNRSTRSFFNLSLLVETLSLTRFPITIAPVGITAALVTVSFCLHSKFGPRRRHYRPQPRKEKLKLVAGAKTAQTRV